MLVDTSAFINFMSLTTLMYLQIYTSKLEGNWMVLKGFNKFGEKALGSNKLAFQIDGWAFEAKFHIINMHTSFNVILERPLIHENRIVSSSLNKCLKFRRNGVEHCIKQSLK